MTDLGNALATIDDWLHKLELVDYSVNPYSERNAPKLKLCLS